MDIDAARLHVVSELAATLPHSGQRGVVPKTFESIERALLPVEQGGAHAGI